VGHGDVLGVGLSILRSNKQRVKREEMTHEPDMNLYHIPARQCSPVEGHSVAPGHKLRACGRLLSGMRLGHDATAGGDRGALNEW
jgi:hypothetical protein